jgi:hypothetical protein
MDRFYGFNWDVRTDKYRAVKAPLAAGIFSHSSSSSGKDIATFPGDSPIITDRSKQVRLIALPPNTAPKILRRRTASGQA